MLSVFHRQNHSNQEQYNDLSEDRNGQTSSPSERLATISSNASSMPSIIADFNNRTATSNGNNDQVDFRQISSTFPTVADVEPQDLSLRPKCQENETENSFGRRCHICDELFLDQQYLARHLDEAHGNETVQEISNQMTTPLRSNQSPVCKVSDNGQSSNGAYEPTTPTVGGQTHSSSLQCPLCNAQLSNETEFVEHYFRNHGADVDSISSLFGRNLDMHLENSSASSNAGIEQRSDLVFSGGGNCAPLLQNGAFCELCNKEFCNKSFLQAHKAKIHGILPAEIEDPSIVQTAYPSNGDSNHQSGTPSPKTPPSSVFDHISNMGNPMSTLPFPPSLDQQQLAAFAQQQNICPFCHQFFPNSMILQNHLLTTHSGLLMNPAAAMYAASMMSTSPFGAGPFFPQPIVNDKANGQQQQMAAIAAAAAMFGFGATPTAAIGDPLAAVGSNLDFFTQGLQQAPGMVATTSSSTSTLNGAKLANRSMAEAALASLTNNGISQKTPTKNMEAYCEICKKEFCNKYFLRTHKLNKHGIFEESPKANGGVGPNGRFGLDSGSKTPTSSPNQLQINSNGRELAGDGSKDAAVAEILRSLHNHGADDDGAPPPSKIPKLMDENSDGYASNTAAASTGQFPCSFCVKTFPSMFALVAHKYRDHGTFDGAVASTLVSQDPAIIQKQLSSSPTSASPIPMPSFGQANRFQQKKQLDNESPVFPSPGKNNGSTQGVDLEAYCEICQKEFCSKYFLKVHRANIHGIGADATGSPSMVMANNLVASLGDRSLNGSILSGILNQESPVGLNLSTAMKQEKENGRKHATNGNSSAAAILMMAAAGVPTGVNTPIGVGRQLVASKNFCDICNKELCNKYFLRTHMLKMHGIVIDENKTVIANINTLDKEKTGELLFRCDLCGEQLASRHQLRAHKQSVHQITVPPSSTLTAPLSLHQSPTASALSSEDKSENDSSQDFSTPNFVKRELSGDFADVPSDVGNGGVEGGREDEKGLDLRQATPKTLGILGGLDFKSVLCTICGKRYKNARCLRMHIMNDHVGAGAKGEPKPAVPTCEYCSMAFPDHTELQLHVINEHQREVRGSVASMAEQAALDALSNNSAFVAAVNSVVNAVAEANAAKETVSTALQVQNGPETPSATPGDQNAELPLVTRAKNGTKLFRCSYCNYYTRWISNLSTHEKRHNVEKPLDGESGEKPFKCRMCLRSYRYSHSLQRHMEVHRSAALSLRANGGGHRFPTTTPLDSSLPFNDNGLKTPPALENNHCSGLSSALSNQMDTQAAFATPGESMENGLSALEPGLTPITTGSPDRRHHCQMCSKAFGNRELYRMHMLTMHNTVLSADAVITDTGSSPTKQRIYRCRMCHFSTQKSYEDLRIHVIQKHNTFSTHSSPQKKPQPPVVQNGVGKRSFDQESSSPQKLNEHCDAAPLEPRYVVQPFMMKDNSSTGVFVNTSMVYLPVLRRVETPIEATITFTPVEYDQVSKNGLDNL